MVVSSGDRNNPLGVVWGHPYVGGKLIHESFCTSTSKPVRPPAGTFSAKSEPQGFPGVVVRIDTVPVGAMIEKLPFTSVVAVFDVPSTVASATTGPDPTPVVAAVTCPVTVPSRRCRIHRRRCFPNPHSQRG